MKIIPERFNGRAAVIVGGASGAGLEIARRLKSEGGAVSLWDINPDTLAEAVGEIGAADSRVIDITDSDAVNEAMKETAGALGQLDVLVVSAGITGATVPVEDFPVESWRRVIDINLTGAFYCCRAAIPYMKQRDYGRIINISSVAGKEGNPNASAYSASKAGLIGLTKSLGKELAKTGIRVNCVTPATFESPILSQMPQSQIDYMLSRIPIGRLGTVEEVASLVSWLASEECSFSTAATFDISGGRTTY